MNVLILGCSYGVPNYGSFGPSPEQHTEFLIESRGHTVHNCSIGGGSNLETLAQAEKFLAGLPISNHRSKDYQCSEIGHLDLVIWFHTELTRDKDTHPFVVYKTYEKFFNSIKTKVAVIGGAGDVMSEFLHFYQPDFFIQSWRRVILNKNIPLTNTLSAAEFIHSSALSKSNRLKLIEDNIAVLNAMNTSPHFFDGAHPGAVPHQELVQRFIDANLVT